MNNTIEELKNKKRKVKAWCCDCFQFFENGPYAKVCQDHLSKGNCNVVECKKKLLLSTNCIRKFPNTNSENRHTHCISKEEVETWDQKSMIQNCLGQKRPADQDISNEVNITKHNKESTFTEVSIKTINEEELNNLVNLQLMKLNDEYELPSNRIEDISKFKFNDNASYDEELINGLNSMYFTPTKDDKKRVMFVVNKQDEITDDEDIDRVFEKIHIQTKIPKNVLNKLKSGFKKKGIFSVKILKLFKEKNKGWEFLCQEFGKVCPQIEAIVLYLENIFDK